MKIDEDKSLYPGKVLFKREFVIWCGAVYDHLYAILDNGDTYRLDRIDKIDGPTREWNKVASLPLIKEIKNEN